MHDSPTELRGRVLSAVASLIHLDVCTFDNIGKILQNFYISRAVFENTFWICALTIRVGKDKKPKMQEILFV